MHPNIESTQQVFSESEDTDLICLVYVSRPTLKGRFNRELFPSIHSKADNYNSRHGITGVLCYGGGYFFQCLEGPKLPVLELMKRIFADDSHKVIHVIYTKLPKIRLFSEWRMHCITLDKQHWDKDSAQAQSESLKSYLPFEPRYWSSHTIESFLSVIQNIQAQSGLDNTHSPIAMLEASNQIGYARPPHVKFLMVQAVLAVVAVVMLMTVV